MQIDRSTDLVIAKNLSTLPMTAPLWGLAIFILWTIAVVVLLLAVRIRHLAAGGSPKEFGIINDESLMWRLLRVQANLVENLPLYLGVVVLLTVREVSGGIVDLLASVYIMFRLLHSIVHIVGTDPRFRVFSLAIQFICLVSLMAMSIFQLTPGLDG